MTGRGPTSPTAHRELPEGATYSQKRDLWSAQLWAVRRRVQWATTGQWRANRAKRDKLGAYMADREAKLAAARRDALAAGAAYLAAQREARRAEQRPRRRGGWTTL